MNARIALAPFRLKPGISEDDLVKTSDDFEEQFVQKQQGILKRILVKDGNDTEAVVDYALHFQGPSGKVTGRKVYMLRRLTLPAAGRSPPNAT